MRDHIDSPRPSPCGICSAGRTRWLSAGVGQFGRNVPSTRLERRACRRAPSEPARGSTPPLRVCHGAHRRASQNGALRHMTAEPTSPFNQLVRAAGDMLRQRTLRAARRTRQTGNRERRAESGAGHGPAPAVPITRSRGFPRRRAVRRATCLPLPITKGTKTEIASMTCDQTHYVSPDVRTETLVYAVAAVLTC